MLSTCDKKINAFFHQNEMARKIPLLNQNKVRNEKFKYSTKR